MNDGSIAPEKATADIYPGVANPVPFGAGDPKTANFIEDPTSDTVGAGAGSNFSGYHDAEKSLKHAAGVVEAKPGIIESSSIDPLAPSSHDQDRQRVENAATAAAHAPSFDSSADSNINASTLGAGSISSAVTGAATVATGAAKVAYGTVLGDQQKAEEGKKDIYGN